MLKKEFKALYRVYIEDTDAGGIVYYVNYLKFLERARTDWLASGGFKQSKLFNFGVMFVIKSLSVEYISSAVLDDNLIVNVVIKRLNKTSLELTQDIVRKDDSRILLTSRCTLVYLDFETRKPIRFSKELYTFFLKSS